MLKNYFKSAWRQLVKNKLFSAVNIIGLSTGLTSIMALSLLIYQFVTTNDNLKGIGQMYYLKTAAPNGDQYTQTVYPLLGEIVKTSPEVQAATHIQSWYYPWLKYNNKEFQETTDFVDTGYFKVFQFPFKYGNPATALNDKFSIVLSDEMAQKFFGNENPVGKTITADDTMLLTVTGVLKHVPSNCTINPTILLPTAILESNPGFKQAADWYNDFASNYLRLRKKSNPKKLDAQIASIVKLNYAKEQKDEKVFVVPFSKIRQEQSSIIGVIIKGAIGAGAFILLIILVNLINLNTASMYARSKEVAVRQMIGVENFHYQDLENNIEPLIQSYGGKPNLENRYLSVRTDPGYMKPVMNQLEQSFKTMPSRRDFSYELMSNKVSQQYALLDGILKVTNYIALLTILIAAMGMFGLISLFAKQRIKEIGIRKVLGASVAGIVGLLSKDFLLLVGIAITIATPITWYIMNSWLQDFAYRINISWWMFLLSGCIAILIAIVTVSIQAIKAAVANPVDSLRTE